MLSRCSRNIKSMWPPLVLQAPILVGQCRRFIIYSDATMRPWKSFPSNKIVSQNTHKKILTYCQKPFSQWRTILSGFKSDAGRRQLLLAGKIERHPAGLWAITARQVVNGGRKDCLPSALSVRTAAPGAARSSFRRHNGLRVREY